MGLFFTNRFCAPNVLDRLGGTIAVASSPFPLPLQPASFVLQRVHELQSGNRQQFFDSLMRNVLHRPVESKRVSRHARQTAR
jgi:hypothetical protein